MTEAVETGAKEKAPKMNNTAGALSKTVGDSVEETQGIRKIGLDALEPVSPLAGSTAVELVQMLIGEEGCPKVIKEAAKKLAKACPKLSEQRMNEALWAMRKALTEKRTAKWERTPEPWPEAVEVRALVQELESLIQEVIYCSPEVASAAAYYCLASWFVEYTDYAPYFCITAATKQCGKSTLMGLMRKLSRKPYPLGASSSAAVVYRIIDLYGPTLFCDEVDTYLKKNEELQGVLNCGNDREGALVPRCDKDRSGRIVPVNFSAYGFKVLSGIQSEGVGGALIDRAIVVCLEPIPVEARKTKTKMRDIEPDRLNTLCRKCARLAEDLGPKIQQLKREERPAFPDSFDSRECDKWELIFTLAQFAGPEELGRITAAALTLKEMQPKEVEWQRELLADIRELVSRALHDPSRTGFDYESLDGRQERFSITPSAAHPDGVILAAKVNDALKSDSDKSWTTFGKNFDGLPVKAQSRALGKFGIRSVSVKAYKGRKCYPVGGPTGLLAAFEKYLPPLPENSAEGFE